MTTIAFKDGVLAADTLTTSQGIRQGYRTKIWRRGRLLYGGTGSLYGTEAFRSWVAAGMDGDHPATEDGNTFVIMPDAVTIMWAGDKPFPISEPFWAVGEGEFTAYGAMEAGASAELAVEIAARRHTHTGGNVETLELNPPSQKPLGYILDDFLEWIPVYPHDNERVAQWLELQRNGRPVAMSVSRGFGLR